MLFTRYGYKFIEKKASSEMTKKHIYNLNNQINYLNRQMFFDESVDIQRYDEIKYPIFEKLTNQQLGYFWTPDEIDVTRDIADFKSMSPHEQHIFTSNLKRQIVLDSVQGRAPLLVLLEKCSLPELESWLIMWSAFENIHSKSYTHIIRNIYSNPTEIFDDINNIPQIRTCAKFSTKYYDQLYNCKTKDMELLYKTIMSVNVLEGLQFYVSFACAFGFAENKLMDGNAKIIKLICRDENLHLASTQHMLKLLRKENPGLHEQCESECYEIFDEVIKMEKMWCKYLFKDGSIIGLNEKILCEYVDHLAWKRMKDVALTPFTPQIKNPISWISPWIAGGNVQVAPQETENVSYVIGGLEKTWNFDTLSKIDL